MKKIIAISSLVMASIASAPSSFAVSTDVKQGTVFTTSTVAGAVLGGPVGFILGALGGAYMGEQIEKADNAGKDAWRLAEAEAHIADLHTQLAQASGRQVIPVIADVTRADGAQQAIDAGSGTWF